MLLLQCDTLTIGFKVLNRRSLDNKIFIFDDKQLEETGIVIDKGLRNAWRIDVFQSRLIKYDRHLPNKCDNIFSKQSPTMIITIGGNGWREILKERVQSVIVFTLCANFVPWASRGLHTTRERKKVRKVIEENYSLVSEYMCDWGNTRRWISGDKGLRREKGKVISNGNYRMEILRQLLSFCLNFLLHRSMSFRRKWA